MARKGNTKQYTGYSKLKNASTGNANLSDLIAAFFPTEDNNRRVGEQKKPSGSIW